MTRRVKRIRAAAWGIEPAFGVELEPCTERGLPHSTDIAVFFQGEHIGFITPHTTQSERKVNGQRYVTRGAPFQAWAQRTLHYDSFDYYAQHRSQSAAIRRLVSEYKSDQRSRS